MYLSGVNIVCVMLNSFNLGAFAAFFLYVDVFFDWRPLWLVFLIGIGSLLCLSTLANILLTAAGRPMWWKCFSD